MKNIHVLPTDKPSRLSIKDSVLILHRLQWRKGTHHIYITSDEEIKEGDWHLVWLRDKWEVLNYMPFIGYRKECLGKEVCKIILTTDQDLIKNGVQAIDDDFLEWFVKNPSCESAEVLKQGVKTKRNQWGFTWKYFIKIPKEEPKQETLEETAFTANLEAFEEFRKGVLEANRFDFVCGFTEGVKWQQEQNKKMYSEEEVRNIANWAFGFYKRNDLSDSELEDEFNRILVKQFKNK